MTFLDRLLDLEKTPQARAYSAEEYNLDRFRAFVDSLGAPDRDLVFVHIAGTKGKGSTAALAEAILRGLGFPTAMYTSPHLAHLGERFRLNGVPWTHEEFEAACERLWESMDPAQRRGFEPPLPWRTVFETLTALALVEFRQFARRQPPGLPTVVVWETGLGGRLDCTNIVDPAVSVITTLGMDHMAVLGDTAEKIAAEKAGIIKRGRPVVIGRQAPEFAERVIPVLLGRAAEVGAPVIRAADHNPIDRIGVSPDGQQIAVTLPDGRLVETTLPLLGAYQCGNAESAIAAAWQVHRLYRTTGAESFHVDGLAAAAWPGRLEVHRRPDGRVLLLDGAHCPLSARLVGEAVRELFPTVPRVLFGMQRDKDAVGFLQGLAEGLQAQAASIPLTTYPVPGPRGATADALAEAAKAAGFHDITLASGPAEALAKSGSLNLAVGTLYTLDVLRKSWLA